MHFLDLGLAVAELIEPLRRPRSAPAGIDDEVGGHLDYRLAGLLDAHTLHDAVLHQQSLHARAVDDAHVRKPLDAAANRDLEQRPAQQQAIEPARELRLVVAVLKPAHVADDVAGHGAGLEQVLLERRKERLQPAQAAREQPVPVMALRHAAAIGDRRRQGVTVEDRDTIEVRAEHARGQQAADARADDDGVVAVEASGRGPWGKNRVH